MPFPPYTEINCPHKTSIEGFKVGSLNFCAYEGYVQIVENICCRFVLLPLFSGMERVFAEINNRSVGISCCKVKKTITINFMLKLNRMYH